MNLIRYAYNRFSTERFPLPTEEQVWALERKLGIEFPPDYREFLLQFNGGYFDTPIIEPVGDDCPEDALLLLCGIGASHREAELADDCYIDLPHVLWGSPRAEAQKIIQEADEYFFALGVTLDSVTRIPGGRR